MPKPTGSSQPKITKLILENNSGQTVRTFLLKGEAATLVQRKDTRRLELISDCASLESRQIKFEILGQVQVESLLQQPFAVSSWGQLRLAPDSGVSVLQNVQPQQESGRDWQKVMAGVGIAALLIIIFAAVRPEPTEKIEAELRQQLVNIVKHIPLRKSIPLTNQVATSTSQEAVIQKTKVQNSVKRLGARAVLGSLNSGAQKGGLNLAAVNTTAGPGLGGTAGSGGVQTSLYGKGLVGAPLGAGANLQGGGGYGTKGKGGGRAGFGTLSLVGSSGANPIPLGKEAIVGGGIDKDLIAAVINKNLGQIRFCYEQGLQGDPALTGRVAVDFTIGGSGAVKIAGVGNTTLNSKLVEDCILVRLKTWKFPLPEGGMDVKVSYPFVLRRSGNG